MTQEHKFFCIGCNTAEDETEEVKSESENQQESATEETEIKA